jgi:hypothetical protein
MTMNPTVVAIVTLPPSQRKMFRNQILLFPNESHCFSMSMPGSWVPLPNSHFWDSHDTRYLDVSLPSSRSDDPSLPSHEEDFERNGCRPCKDDRCSFNPSHISGLLHINWPPLFKSHHWIVNNWGSCKRAVRLISCVTCWSVSLLYE